MKKTERLYMRTTKDVKAKIEQIAKEENRSMNNWIETTVLEKLEEKEMTKYKLVAYEEGQVQEVWAEGTEEEIIKQFNQDKVKGLEWIEENDKDLYLEAISEQVTNLRELEYVLDLIDHSWWTLRLEEI